MHGDADRPLHQSFLPAHGKARAFVWKYSPVDGGRRPRHFHAEPELNLIVQGSAVFGVGEARICVRAGELIGFPPGQDHVLLHASRDLYLFAIGTAPRLSSEVLRGHRDHVPCPVHVRLAPADFEALASRAAELLDREGAEQPIAELWEHAHWAQQRHVGRSSGTLHSATRRALAVLLEQPELALDALARRVRTSPTEVSRHFHRDVGMPLASYRNRVRMLRLIELVDDGERNLMSAATAAGFGSYSQCHRVFHAQMGCAPRQFFDKGFGLQMQQLYAPERVEDAHALIMDV